MATSYVRSGGKLSRTLRKNCVRSRGRSINNHLRRDGSTRRDNGERRRSHMGTVSSATRVLGCMAVCCLVLSGCASTKAAVAPPAEAVSLPVVEPVSSAPIGPPPGYTKPENYWVREKIILTSAPEPAASPTKKSSGNLGKKSQKMGKSAF
jgi:hypothetical protein